MSGQAVRIIHNPVKAKVLTDDITVRNICSEILSYKVDAAVNTDIKGWDGYASLYVMKDDTFPAGLVRFIKKKLEKIGYQVFVKSKPFPEPQGEENPTVDNFGYDPRYDYQLELTRRLASLRAMIAQVATGGGKSRCFKLCERRLALPTLFLTNRKSLMYQMAETYKNDLSLPIGLIGDGHWSPIKDGANFAIVDTLASRLEEYDINKDIELKVKAHKEKVTEATEEKLKELNLPTNLMAMDNDFVPEEVKARLKSIRDHFETSMPLDMKKIERDTAKKASLKRKQRNEALEFLEGIGFLTLEEAHDVSGTGFYKVAQACKNAHYRLALTATPFMKDSEEANKKLMACTGQVGIKVSEKLLIDREILARPYFKFISTKKPEKLYRSSSWQKAYVAGIVENSFRNEAILNESKRFKKYGLTQIILVNRKAHGDRLLKMLKSSGISAKFIFGDHDQKDRKKALDQLGSKKIDVLIGSTILDVGVDVPSVGAVILAGGGKAEVQTRQRIGRGLRAKKTGPNVCFIVDFNDEHNTHLKNHSMERRRIIESTPGFAEGIVPDFEFEMYGLNPL